MTARSLWPPVQRKQRGVYMRSKASLIALVSFSIACGKAPILNESASTPNAESPVLWQNQGNALATPICIGHSCKAVSITSTSQDFEIREGQGVPTSRPERYAGGPPVSVATGTTYAIVAGLWGSLAFDESWGVNSMQPAASATVAAVPGNLGYYLLSARYTNSAGLHIEVADKNGEVSETGGILGAGKDESYACAPIADGVASLTTVLGGPRRFAVAARRFVALPFNSMRTEFVVKVYEHSATGLILFTEIAGFTLGQKTGDRSLSCSDLYSLKDGPRGFGVYQFDDAFAVVWYDGRNILLNIARSSGTSYQPATMNVVYDTGTVFGSAPNGQLVVVTPDKGNDLAHVSYVNPDGQPGTYRSLGQRISWASLGVYGVKTLVLFSPLGPDKKAIGVISTLLFD